MRLKEKLEDQIYLYENVLDDPKRLVELLEELDNDPSTHAAIPEWSFWFSNTKDGHSFGSKKDFEIPGLEGLESDRKEDVEWIINQVRGGIEKCARSYYKDRGFEEEPNISPFAGVMKYRPGCSMGAHFDAQSGDRTLKYSIIIYVNDDYEGGELSFIVRPYDLRNPKNHHLRPTDDANDPENKELTDFIYTPKAGEALVFPSTHPYKHQVHVVKSGDKYMIPGFCFVPEFDANDQDMKREYNQGGMYEDANENIRYMDEEYED